MSAVRGRGSTSERAIRRRLFANGLRYRVASKLPGKPDIVFPRQRVAIFIDGDLWHGNSWRVRGLPSLEAQFPTRTEWWVSKIRRTMERDQEVNRLLAEAGWTILRFWETDVLSDPNRVARSIAELIKGRPLPDFRSLALSSEEKRRLASVKPAQRPARHANPNPSSSR